MPCTVTVQAASWVEETAKIRVFPAATPVTVPDWSTSATALSSLRQVTVWGAVSGTTVAVRRPVYPGASSSVVGVTDTPVGSAGLTVMVQVSFWASPIPKGGVTVTVTATVSSSVVSVPPTPPQWR